MNTTIELRREGFTLIELLVVIGVLGILVSALVFLIDPRVQFDKARDAERKSDLVQIRNSLETYYQDHNSYPSPASAVCMSNTAIASFRPYMATIPLDPIRGATNCPCYLYSVASNSQSYSIFAHLDAPADYDALKTKHAPLSQPAGTLDASMTQLTVSTGTCAGSTYNYWVNTP